MALRLIDLLAGDENALTEVAEVMDVEITGLTSDSRRVAPGFLFAAIPGATADGRDFIDQAVERGAVAVLAPPGTRQSWAPPLGAPPDGLSYPSRQAVQLMEDENPRRRFALLAARYFEQQPATIAAVTGTNGKSSVVSFLRQIWTRLGRQAASLGTLGVDTPYGHMPLGLTTPDPADLHASLRDMVLHGVDCLAMEASSHGLSQNRLDGVAVGAALFTNLSRDHLDYHGTMDAYLTAKLRLFDEVMAPGGIAVINADASSADAVGAICRKRRHRIFTYGRGSGLGDDDIRITALKPLDDGQEINLRIGEQQYAVTVPLVGEFQAENAIGALALAVALGEDAAAVVATLEFLEGVPGRVQRVARHANGAPVYIDYAHTPDALDHVLGALRTHTQGRLIAVFGCGGDRDQGKRPVMGAVAKRLADSIIVTDDNPRSEDAAAIRRQILDACPEAREIGDRAEAIAVAIAELASDDVLVIAGKGHEQGQIVGADVRPFDDAETARAVIRAINGEAGL